MIDSMSQNFNFRQITTHLESLEEKIIFKLLDRAQYQQNLIIYQLGKSGVGKFPAKSLLDLRLSLREKIESKFGRYSLPEERPFTSNLPPPERGLTTDYKKWFPFSDLNTVNLTAEIKSIYLSFIPQLCAGGVDNYFLASAESDVYALQALSERIHYGAFYVSEAKYQSDPEKYQELIDQSDPEKLIQKLRRPEVEEKILNRINHKVNIFEQGLNTKARKYVAPETMVEIYQKMIIPLTIKGELLYLAQRKRK